MQPIKNWEWLVKYEKMQEVGLKEYYEKIFKEILEEIQINKSKKKIHY
ncbi:MAG: hypothetical protein ACFE91_16155 [Promethearchaeota archaeon]